MSSIGEKREKVNFGGQWTFVILFSVKIVILSVAFYVLG